MGVQVAPKPMPLTGSLSRPTCLFRSCHHRNPEPDSNTPTVLKVAPYRMLNIELPIALPPVPQDAFDDLSEATRGCITRLMNSSPGRHDLSVYPRTKLGAVLVLLYEDAGELRVLLTTRSKSMRSHPGQTALPGGKADETDTDFLETAHREAFEEVGLPRNSPYVHTVATLDPFISRYKVVVIPVVAVLTRPSLLDELKASPAEVDRIFTHPLRAILDPSLAKSEVLAAPGTEDWPYPEEYYNTSDHFIDTFGDMAYRMHRLRSCASPVKGLTADVLIKVAEIAYDQGPIFERWAPKQPVNFSDITNLIVQLRNRAENMAS